MALNFGKLDFSVSFNPTSAFPLDARSYFESLESANAAAATAEEVGSKNTIYYYGQTIVVVENNLATLYIIQPDKSLAPVGSTTESSSFEIDPNQFIFEDGQLSLLDFTDATEGQMLVKGSNGQLTWVTPIDTYTKVEIEQRLAAVGHLKRKIVKDVEAIEQYIKDNTDYYEYIFMVSNGPQNYDDKYDEYIVIEEFDSDNISLGEHIEKVGSWEVKLDDYATKEDLKNYIIDPKDGSRLISSTEINKLAALNENAEENYIKDVDDANFSVDTDGKLTFSKTFSDKIVTIETTLDDKVDKQEGYTLLSPVDQKKLNALKLDGTDLEISGKVKAENIEDLDDWIAANASTHIVNLDEGNLTSDLKDKINSSISKVDENYFQVIKGSLSLTPTIANTLNTLNDTFVTVVDFNATVGNLDELLKNQVNIVNEIADINDRLAWKEIADK